MGNHGDDVEVNESERYNIVSLISSESDRLESVRRSMRYERIHTIGGGEAVQALTYIFLKRQIIDMFFT